VSIQSVVLEVTKAAFDKMQKDRVGRIILCLDSDITPTVVNLIREIGKQAKMMD
jgi:hypothetical protein